MAMYVLELYDKDNDIYEAVAYSDSDNKLRQYGKPIENLIKRDMVVRHCSDGTKEPFDSCRVRKLEFEEQMTYTGNIIFI